MYPQPQIVRPLAAMGALVAATLFATATVTVAPGDTLSEIAARHDVTVAELMEWNDLADPDRIVSGASLIISSDGSTAAATTPSGSHLVTAGDTLSAIAVRFGTSVAELVAANDLGDPDRIRVGQSLRLSTTPATTTTLAPRTHTVVAGDTLSSIARTYGVKAGVLAADNGIADPDRIVIGAVLTIGDSAPAAADPTVPSTDVETSTTTTTTAPATTDTAAPSVGTVLVSPMFAQWAATYRVPQDLLEAIAWRESSWVPGATGANGKLGIMQLSPERVELIEGGLLGRDLDPLDADDSIQMGARYLRYLLDRTAGERDAVAAWHQGLGDVQTNGVNQAGAAYADAIEEIRRQRG